MANDDATAGAGRSIEAAATPAGEAGYPSPISEWAYSALSRPPHVVAPADHYGLIRAWGNWHDLPSDEEYRARLDRAYPATGRRGHTQGMSVERLRLAETARALRKLGATERAIALDLCWDGQDTPKPDAPEQRRRRLERHLRELESWENQPRPKRPQPHTRPRQQAAEAAASSVAAEDRAERALLPISRYVREDGSGRLLTAQVPRGAAYLRAEAAYLRRHVEARDAAGSGNPHVPRRARRLQRADMLAVADELEQEAAELERAVEAREAKARAKRGRSVTPRRVDPAATRRHDFHPLAHD